MYDRCQLGTLNSCFSYWKKSNL
ncbi:hypothetical protein Gorai_004248, partial [Gossypium raimondii]|nr:hypothetical protein [Gossypium raimondii]